MPVTSIMQLLHAFFSARGNIVRIDSCTDDSIRISLTVAIRLIGAPVKRYTPTHKWPVTRKMFPFDDFIMIFLQCVDYVLINYLYVQIVHKHYPGIFLRPCNYCTNSEFKISPDISSNIMQQISAYNATWILVKWHEYSFHLCVFS